MSEPAGRNWAGNHTYRASRLVRVRSVEELQELVARSHHVRALGSRHSFTDLADTTDDGTLVSLEDLSRRLDLDEAARTVTVDGGVRYGELAEALNARGWGLASLASLPHISVAGAVATGTHGSGDKIGSLAAAVTAIETVRPDGSLHTVRRGDDDFDGSVVALGALGVVSALTLEIEPTFDVRQDVWTALPWSAVEDSFDALTGLGYSVSLFTRFTDAVEQIWVKSRAGAAPVEVFGAQPATELTHMLAGGDTEALTDQLGVSGPWHERLPHFRMAFTPSRGEELQSEYLLPRACAAEAITALRSLGEELAPLLQVCELRTIAADTLWLSGSYGRATLGVHFTWVRDVEAVYAVLAKVEAALLPLGGRPHWGKCFTAAAADLAAMYPRMEAFRELRERVDPNRVFGNAFLERTIG